MKPLHQLFHILKFQILNYPFRFIGMLHYVVFMGIMQLSSLRYNGLPWESHPSASYALFLILSWVVLEQSVFSGDARFTSGASPLSLTTGSFSFLWTRALDRSLIQLSQIVLYAVFVIVILLPGIAQLAQPMEPLQIRFQSPEDNGAFQQALLAEPLLGAYRFYDYAKRIVVAIPHGGQYRIGLWLYQNVFLSLLFLWIFKRLNLSEARRNMLYMTLPFLLCYGLVLPWYGWLLVLLSLLVYLVVLIRSVPTPRPFRLLLSPLVLPMIIVLMISSVGALKLFPSFHRFLERHLPPDPTFYGEQFLLYANCHLWLWAGLTLAGVALIQSIIQRHARLS